MTTAPSSCPISLRIGLVLSAQQSFHQVFFFAYYCLLLVICLALSAHLQPAQNIVVVFLLFSESHINDLTYVGLMQYLYEMTMLSIESVQ